MKQQEIEAREQDSSNGHIGLFTLLAIVLLLLAWGWWKSFSIQPPQRFSVLFSDVAGLNVNAPVNVDGLHIGSVENLRLEGRRRVRVGIKINVEPVRIPFGSTFTILSNGAIGSKYVEILLPEISPGAHEPALLSESSVVLGEKTVRVETVVNNIAGALENVDFRAVDAKLSRSVDSLNRASNSVTYLVNSSKPLTARTLVLEGDLISLTREIRQTNAKINRLLDDRKFMGNLKEIAEKLRETSERVQSTVSQVSSTLADKPMRQDILSALDKLKDSTKSLENSADACTSLADNPSLRSDIMQILGLARDDINSLNKLVGTSKGNSDLHGILAQTRQTIQHINLAAEQMNQILDKRAPLLHLFFGRPGHLRTVQAAGLNRTPN